MVQVSQFSELVRYSRPMLTAAGIFTVVIMVVGVLGNLLTLVALLRHSKLRTVAAAFIASLCISDLLFCFLVLPFSASQFFHGAWIHGDVLCVMIPTLRYGSVGVSLLSVASISINRYILIAWPHLYQKIYSRLKVAIYISLIWIFSYGLQIPILLGKWGVYGMDKKLGTCSINKDEHGHSSKTALFVIGFALPCIIIVICYAKIYWVVRQSHKKLQQHNTGNKYKRSEMRITKMVLVIFLCFVVCYLPITLVKIFDQEVKQPLLHVVGYLLIYLSSCVNPVVYVTMNKQYRVAYLETLRCKYNSNLDSQQTQPPQSKTHNMSVTYLKNMVSQSPKV
ncbi:G-protein coupled receptor moody-like isoform X1 [Anoplophora glabripennis]|uniref:G-protein coupled receptor moody-like isoform X1 n=2 Tax=Anoplophora glabripennis TaxID=217634 RepID=UPI000874886C|nr:G-protein coupled receptor moody-like isoform X1 [Anoplophora glabripennis]